MKNKIDWTKHSDGIRYPSGEIRIPVLKKIRASNGQKPFKRVVKIIEGSSHQRISDASLRMLWGSVLTQAIQDATSEVFKNSVEEYFVRNARFWISSNSEGPNSFLNICDYLRLDPGEIRRMVSLGKGAA